MDRLANSPEIIAAIIGGAFLLLTTILGGWFNLRAAQIQAERLRAIEAGGRRGAKGKQPAEEPPPVARKQPLPTWLLIGGAGIGVLLLIGGLGLGGMLQTASPTETPQPTATATATMLYLAGPTSTPILTETPLPLGFTPVEHNILWVSVIHVFDGMQMVLVPAGCFTMGSENGKPEETPISQICFDRPFWIDRTEVTNAQFGEDGCEKGADLPHECVTWFDAQAFCEGRQGGLPTEAEWEYAASGPDNLDYPWGNVFFDANAYVIGNSNGKPHDAGSKPGGMSWVGALDMTGNVWEWTSSLYMPYPYNPNDGRENPVSAGERVVRGGSFDSGGPTVNFRYGFVSARYTSVGFRCVRDWSPDDVIP